MALYRLEQLLLQCRGLAATAHCSGAEAVVRRVFELVAPLSMVAVGCASHLQFGWMWVSALA